MNRSSGLRAYDKTKLKAMNFENHLSLQAIARIINFSQNNLPVLGFYRRIIEWNKIFMAILQKQKEMFYWNNVNIRQNCWRLIKAKLLSFSNNADTETEVFHWFKTKTKCQISVPGERKKNRQATNMKDNYSSQISTLLLTFLREASLALFKLKIVLMAERIKR